MNTLDEEILKIKEYGILNKVPIIKDDGLLCLEETILKNNVRNILEIGTAIGYSAICMAKLDPNIHITTIERNKDMYDLALENIKKTNLEDRIEVVFMDALEYETEKKFDLIFIDAAKAQYTKFFNKFEGLLDSKGIVFSDNLAFHGLVKNPVDLSKNLRGLIRKINEYRSFLLSLDNYFTEIYDNIGDGVSISIKK